MSKSLKEITDIIEDFGLRRGWLNSDPNQLITSILIETGELAENYQWQNKFKKLSETEKTNIGFEFVDIIFYLFRLARNSDIDIEKYFDMKLKKLEKKFPVGQNSKEYFKIRKEYRKTGKNKLYD